jgi:glycine/D-amino acid oxidase-like deaminating enzyme
VVLAGFSGHGFKFGALIGEAVAAALTGERPAAAITAWAAGQP